MINGKQITQINYLKDCLKDDYRDSCLFDNSLYFFDSGTSVMRLDIDAKKE